MGDSLQLKWSPDDWGAVTVSDAGQIFDLVGGTRPTAVLAYREITVAERVFVNGVYRLFSEGPGGAADDHSVGESYGVLAHW